MNIKQQFVMREVAGEILLVPVGKTSLNLNGMITLNEVGAEIWKLLPTAKDKSEIVAAIAAQYDAPQETIAADVEAFLAQLRDLHIVE